MARDKNLEKKILRFCGSYFEEHYFPPSYQEIMDAVGLASKSTVSIYMARLVKNGDIIFDPVPGSRKYRIAGYTVTKDK